MVKRGDERNRAYNKKKDLPIIDSEGIAMLELVVVLLVNTPLPWAELTVLLLQGVKVGCGAMITNPILPNKPRHSTT